MNCLNGIAPPFPDSDDIINPCDNVNSIITLLTINLP
jgi:hypothetical protein